MYRLARLARLTRLLAALRVRWCLPRLERHVLQEESENQDDDRDDQRRPEGGLDADEQRVFGDDEELVERVGYLCVKRLRDLLGHLLCDHGDGLIVRWAGRHVGGGLGDGRLD